MEKVAIFPDGYKKTKDATVSERAIMHMNELIELQGEYECYLIFIVQRKDCKYFSPSPSDKLFIETFKKAKNNGVKILAYSVYWKGTNLLFNKRLNVIFDK
jgi:DNA-binding sugar fermentation-stimulating protein